MLHGFLITYCNINLYILCELLNVLLPTIARHYSKSWGSSSEPIVSNFSIQYEDILIIAIKYMLPHVISTNKSVSPRFNGKGIILWYKLIGYTSLYCALKSLLGFSNASQWLLWEVAKRSDPLPKPEQMYS